jgi:hypothetical protein
MPLGREVKRLCECRLRSFDRNASMSKRSFGNALIARLQVSSPSLLYENQRSDYALRTAVAAGSVGHGIVGFALP